MQSELAFFDFDTREVSSCGQVLDIEFSNAGLGWKGIVLEKGQSPHFYPDNVYTPYFYFALALEQDLHWSARTESGIAELKTSPGNIWINPPHTPFSHQVDEPCYFVILAVEEQEFLAHCPLNLKGKTLQFLNNYNVLDESIKGIIELFMLEVKNKGRNGVSYVHNLLAVLANHYIQNYSNFTDLTNQHSGSKLDQAQVERIDNFIAEHISRNIAVDELAELLGCSKFYFLREFKKLLGITPYQYLMNKRMQQAKFLLGQSKHNIASVALELGFNDQSHFTRVFKSQLGLTPGQFQKQLQ